MCSGGNMKSIGWYNQEGEKGLVAKVTCTCCIECILL